MTCSIPSIQTIFDDEKDDDDDDYYDDDVEGTEYLIEVRVVTPRFETTDFIILHNSASSIQG